MRVQAFIPISENVPHPTLSSESSELNVRHRALEITAPLPAQLFRQALHRWYGHHGRDLPWRGTRDRCAILVSEFMLQQTGRDCDPILRGMAAFRISPHWRASENEGLRAWQVFPHEQMVRRMVCPNV